VLTVVGEGVETPVQLDALRRHGCDVAQGYWIFRPASARAITDWLRANQTGPPVWSSLHLEPVDDGRAALWSPVATDGTGHEAGPR
jgi:predicted signal transduction protein with EAL and GGDEF domain